MALSTVVGAQVLPRVFGASKEKEVEQAVSLAMHLLHTGHS